MLTFLWVVEGWSEPSSWKRNHLGKKGRNQGQQSTQAHIWRPVDLPTEFGWELLRY